MSRARQIKHDEQRNRIAEIVASLIARSGLEGVTMRQVAETAGFSTTIVTHYFANKMDLLYFTYKWISARSYAAVDDALRNDPLDLVGLLEALAYVDRPEYWRVYFAFWQISLIDVAFKAEQGQREKDVRRLLVELMQRRLAAGLPLRNADLDQAAKTLVLMVQGLGLQSILHDDDWDEARKRTFLREQAARITG